MIIRKIQKKKHKIIIAIKKKIFPLAVSRNKIKRRLRNALGQFVSDNYTILITNIDKNEIEYEQMQACIFKFFDKNIEN